MTAAAGIPGLPRSAFFTGPAAVVLALHIVAGLIAVVAGVRAATAVKRPGPHPRAGTVYVGALLAAALTALVLTALRGRENAHLAILAVLATAAALYGRRYAPSRLSRVRRHIVGMSASYVLLLTAFYVDNGPQLPLWRYLPTAVFWVGPALIAVPLVARALRRHARAPGAGTQT